MISENQYWATLTVEIFGWILFAFIIFVDIYNIVNQCPTHELHISSITN